MTLPLRSHPVPHCALFSKQGGMHVNGAPPLMQPPMQGGVPTPGQMPSAVPGPGPLAPGGEFSVSTILGMSAQKPHCIQ